MARPTQPDRRRQNAPLPAIQLRRRRESGLLQAYIVILALVCIPLAIASRVALRHPDAGTMVPFAVLALLAVLSRQERIWRYRIQASAIAPAFFFATNLLSGPAAAAGAVVLAYAADIWQSGRRRHPLAMALTQVAASLTAAVVLYRLGGPSVRVATATPALVAAAAYWGTWQLLAAPIRWLSASSRVNAATGLREEAIRGFLLLLAGITVAVLWDDGGIAVACGLVTLVFLNRAVSSSHFGREALLEPKTGLFNARYFQEVTESELLRCRRLERPASILMCDLDHLREVNNTYGHQTGDGVILRIAELIREGTRGFDVPSRFGGEEFAILLPETSKRRARVIAERLRQSIEAELFESRAHGGMGLRQFSVTVSIGVATFPEDASTADTVIARADQAAYAAKRAGRNQVQLFSAEQSAAEAGAAPRLT